MRRVLITLGLGALAAIGLAAGLLATAARAGSEPNVAICHYVPGNGNTGAGWTLIPNIDQAGAWGHRGNQGNHDGKDIIPALNFKHGNVQIVFAGQGDQSILANDCKEEEENKGTLIVKKVVVNDNGGTAAADDFSFTVNGRGPVGFESDGSNEYIVPSGYVATVAETAAEGYTTSYSATNGGTVEAGATLTITVTNDDVKKGDEKGTLVINKVLVTDDGAVADESDFSFKVNNRGPFAFESDGSNSYPVPAGHYNVVEVNPGAGWTVTGGGVVEVEEGTTTVVTITNDDVAEETETTPTDTTPTDTTPTDTTPTTPTDTTPTTTTDTTPTTTTDTTPTTTTETTPTTVPAAPFTPPKAPTKPAAKPMKVKKATRPAATPTKPTVKVKGAVAENPPKLAYTP